ncbi:ATP/GTP-binding protein [Intrasporangium chromatireducens]|nr:ATP/GTP-binding protein [Intrasporangium chromatireducens]
MPCRDGDAWWSNGWGCYVKTLKRQPPKADPRWAGHWEGTIYECYDPLVASAGGMALTYRWSATPPAGPAAPPDPRVLAQQAIAQMRLHAVSIGIVPEPRVGRVGVIGMPTWMWVQNPGPSTLGPITRTASAGGFSVTATAKADRVVWQMGDGATVTCHGAGTPYADSFGRQSSPDCGHIYARRGTFTVRATSYWNVAWSGMGLTGTIPLNFTRTTNITMGEAQVLTQ